MKGFEAMSDKKRHTIWIDERIWEDVLSHYKSDNCSTQNEFVENALRFYIGYLNTKSAGAFLPQAISSVMIGTMDNYARRVGSQLYKLAVVHNKMIGISAGRGFLAPSAQISLTPRCH